MRTSGKERDYALKPKLKCHIVSCLMLEAMELTARRFCLFCFFAAVWRARIVGGWDTWRRQHTRDIGPKLTGTKIWMFEICIGFFTNLWKAGPFQAPQLDLFGDVTMEGADTWPRVAGGLCHEEFEHRFAHRWLKWLSIGLSRGRSWVQLRSDQHSGS